MSDGDQGLEASEGASARQARPTVFISYATQDRPAAQSLRDALATLGVEVWYDESELGGGDAWDQKIRRQIRECDFFMPVVSAQTDARLEGYFRREWRLAVERTLDMADDHLFLLPVVIDDTDQAVARVPEKFLAVQWLKVPGGRATPALEALGRRLASGEAAKLAPARRSTRPGRDDRDRPARPDYPPFPAADPADKARRALALARWATQSAWVGFRRLPRWIRIIAVTWLVIALLSHRWTAHHEESGSISPATAAKLRSIADQYQGSTNKADVARLGAQIAHEFAADASGDDGQTTPMLAIPFVAPPGDPAADKLADAAFAMVYGRLSVSRHGHVSLADEPLAATELGAALERGRALNTRYVVFGAVERSGTGTALRVQIASVAEHSVAWTKSYPIAGSDPSAIAAEVDAGAAALDD